ncbi:MAG: acetyl-CoA C-acetyltransferase [Propionibacteriaceae bacterium]|nr:acetyl-CoA C-acetyltransferase [Propionibacteriaceae bacterium]
MTDVFIVSACRTPIGSFGQALAGTGAVGLGTIVVKEALVRAGLAPDQVDEVLLGCVLTAGLGQNVARQVGMGAGLPVTVPATTINMMCGSGMKSVVEAARSIKARDAHVVVAGGTESMSGAAYVSMSTRWGARMGDTGLADTMVRDGLTDVFNNYHMGITAENVAQQWGITREQMDQLALRSQQRALAAVAAGRFADEIVPVTVKTKKAEIVVNTDEYPRETSLEILAQLRPAFKEGGTVTAGNASGINDGAAAVVLASSEAVREYKLTPLAKLVGYGQHGVDPSVMGTGPIGATKKALEAARLGVSDLDLCEVNEAFAAQAQAVINTLGLNVDTLNVNGGAIALGHPIGASGARIIVTLLYEMAKRPDARRGLAALCIGGGMGIASVYERC